MASVALPMESLAPRSKPAIEAPPADFVAWRETLRGEALTAGVSQATFDRAFAGVRPLPDIIEREATQPEFVRPVWDYLDSALSAERVSAGREALATRSRMLSEIETRYGVPKEILVAIWGLESAYGRLMGSEDVIATLATLAYAGRRRDFFRSELIAALKILEAGDAFALTGSWAGAMGHTQFMPTTFLVHAVDGDGDHKRDIWSSEADALASAASYLATSGWRAGLPWGRAVLLPESFDFALAELTVAKPVREWAALGIRNADGTPLEAGDAFGEEPASILVPAGHRGPAFLITDNFRSILKYNNSTAYALAVSQLAERFAGVAPLAASWPREARPLALSEREELQRLLIAEGQPLGAVDGILGIRTREAVRAIQAELGRVPDGFVTEELLLALRERASRRDATLAGPEGDPGSR